LKLNAGKFLFPAFAEIICRGHRELKTKGFLTTRGDADEKIFHAG
jgi:hypothetical protein